MLHSLPRVGTEAPVFPSSFPKLPVLLIVLRELSLSLSELVVVVLKVVELRS